MPNDQPQPVAPGITCKTCDYQLRGLTFDRNCPECGTPVSHSAGDSPVLTMPWPQRRGLAWSIGWLQAGTIAPVFIAAADLPGRWILVGLFLCYAVRTLSVCYAARCSAAIPEHVRRRLRGVFNGLVIVTLLDTLVHVAIVLERIEWLPPLRVLVWHLPLVSWMAILMAVQMYWLDRLVTYLVMARNPIRCWWVTAAVILNCVVHAMALLNTTLGWWILLGLVLMVFAELGLTLAGLCYFVQGWAVRDTLTGKGTRSHPFDHLDPQYAEPDP